MSGVIVAGSDHHAEKPLPACRNAINTSLDEVLAGQEKLLSVPKMRGLVHGVLSRVLQYPVAPHSQANPPRARARRVYKLSRWFGLQPRGSVGCITVELTKQTP